MTVADEVVMVEDQEDVSQMDAGANQHDGGHKKRNQLSQNCAECRRAKVKCDRQRPCGGCVKRGCAQLCPDHTVGSVQDLVLEREALAQRVKQLEEALEKATLLATSLESAHSHHRPGSSTSSLTTAQTSPFPSPLSTHPSLHKDDQAAKTTLSPVDSIGTLVIVPDGRAKYIGPSAHVQWLSETASEPSHPAHPNISLSTDPPTLPHTTLFSQICYLEARLALPKDPLFSALIEAFFTHIAWNGVSVHRIIVDSIVTFVNEDPIETIASLGPDKFGDVAYQKLALLFSVLAVGAMMDLKTPLDDTKGRYYFGLAGRCLASGNYMVAGTNAGVQAVSLMARFASYSDLTQGWELSFQLRGIAARMVISMGMHRDGEAWQLSRCEKEERRRIFWDVFSCDILLARDCHRPCIIAPDMFDCKLPHDFNPSTGMLDTGFLPLKFELAMLMQQAVMEATKIKPSPFPVVMEINQKLSKFEAKLPAHLSTRPFPPIDESSADPRLTLQRYNLNLDVCASVFILLRPYFVKALCEYPNSPQDSPYAEAYFAVCESSSMLIAIIKDAHASILMMISRHWWIWTHVFSAAVCLASIPIMAPSNPKCNTILADLDTVTGIFHAHAAIIPRQAAQRNFQTLLQLRNRAMASVIQWRRHHPNPRPEGSSNPDSVKEREDHLNLVGWKTKVVMREHVRRGSSERPPATRPTATRKGSDGRGTSATPRGPSLPPMSTPDSEGRASSHSRNGGSVSHSQPTRPHIAPRQQSFTGSLQSESGTGSSSNGHTRSDDTIPSVQSRAHPYPPVQLTQPAMVPQNGTYHPIDVNGTVSSHVSNIQPSINNTTSTHSTGFSLGQAPQSNSRERERIGLPRMPKIPFSRPPRRARPRPSTTSTDDLLRPTAPVLKSPGTTGRVISPEQANGSLSIPNSPYRGNTTHLPAARMDGNGPPSMSSTSTSLPEMSGELQGSSIGSGGIAIPHQDMTVNLNTLDYDHVPVPGQETHTDPMSSSSAPASLATHVHPVLPSPTSNPHQEGTWIWQDFITPLNGVGAWGQNQNQNQNQMEIADGSGMGLSVSRTGDINMDDGPSASVPWQGGGGGAVYEPSSNSGNGVDMLSSSSASQLGLGFGYAGHAWVTPSHAGLLSELLGQTNAGYPGGGGYMQYSMSMSEYDTRDPIPLSELGQIVGEAGMDSYQPQMNSGGGSGGGGGSDWATAFRDNQGF